MKTNADVIRELRTLSREAADHAAHLEAAGEHDLATLVLRIAAILQRYAEDGERDD